MATWDVSADPVDFDEAIEWFRGRVPMLPEEWAELEQAARQRAFTVAHVTNADVVAHVWSALDASIANGETFEDFSAAIGDELEDAWQGDVANPAHRLETIFRTNVQSAYGAGRYRQLEDPAVLRRRPYRRMDVLLDNRTSEICSKVAGVILPADHPWWKGRIPPLHFNCRTTISGLTEEEATRLGITRNPPRVKAQDGFGDAPAANDDWEPDLSGFPEHLRGALRSKLDEDDTE